MSNPKLEVLTPPANCQLIFIDQQPQMAFGVQSIDRQVLKNNVVGLAKAAKVFGIPTTITTVETESFSGYTYPELLDVFPGKEILERTSMNSWDDQKVRDALAANGRKKVVVSGLWTEVCNTTFALCAMLEGEYEIYMVADASGGTSKDAHDFAMQRMIQAGVVPVTWQQVLLEWQRDWAHRDTYNAVIDIVARALGRLRHGRRTTLTPWCTRRRSAPPAATKSWRRCPPTKARAGTLGKACAGAYAHALPIF
jgi:nicotinamidase-related amidase